jgi:hypothetical protein
MSLMLTANEQLKFDKHDDLLITSKVLINIIHNFLVITIKVSYFFFLDFTPVPYLLLFNG